MNIDDALRCIEQHIRPGMTVEIWQTTNCKMVRRVVFNDCETYADTPEKFALAIEAVEVIAELPTTLDGFSENAGWNAERNTPDYATDTPNVKVRGAVGASSLTDWLDQDGAESLLRRILKHFYIENGELLWRHIDGVTLAEVEGLDFETNLRPFLEPDVAEEIGVKKERYKS